MGKILWKMASIAIGIDGGLPYESLIIISINLQLHIRNIKKSKPKLMTFQSLNAFCFFLVN